MSKEKQIEEMAKVMANGRFVEPNNNQIRIFIGEAESLYNAGYRKQSETLSEFLQMVKNICSYEERLSFEVIEQGIKRQIEKKCGVEEAPKAKKRALYEGFSSHDCEAWYRCPSCENTFGSWTIFGQKKNENGTNKYCPHCKEELDGLD